MPTIEIVCVGAKTIPDLPIFSTFGWLAETKLQSHRGIFQPIFDITSGVIVHLVTKGFEDPNHDGGLFAGELIDWNGSPAKYVEIDDEAEATEEVPEDQEDEDEDEDGDEEWDHQFVFEPEVGRDLRQLMEVLLTHSPEGMLYFTTDWQFGPEEEQDRFGYTLESFFGEHDWDGLRWHRLYRIGRE